MEEGYNQKLNKEREINIQKIKEEKDKSNELLNEKRELENEYNKLKIQLEKHQLIYQTSNQKLIIILIILNINNIHYIKNILDDIFGEEEFNEVTYILMKNLEAHKIDSEKLDKVNILRLFYSH